MMNINTLKYFLLATLLVMLAFVLYKRLIAALSKGKGRRNYLKILEAELLPVKQEVWLHFEAQRGFSVTVSLHDAQMKQLASEPIDILAGEQSIMINAQGHAAATWVRVVSEFETVERRLESK